MAVELPLAQMSLDDKLQAMELLWADLSKDPSQVVSPAWHGEELRRRQEAVRHGKASFQSWESGMDELRAELSGQTIG
jgi:hypothetical protein